MSYRFCLVFSLILLLGCTNRVVLMIEGEVSYEGEPIAEGNIAFVSTDPHVADAGASIVNGKYQLEVPPGEKKIVITATREEGEIDPQMGARRRVSYLPEEYSTDTSSILKETVTKEGKRKFDFHLQKPPPRDE